MLIRMKWHKNTEIQAYMKFNWTPMELTEDKIIKEVIKEFRKIVDFFAKNGREIVLNECVDQAIKSTFDLYRSR